MPKVKRNGVELYYETSGSGPVVLLTHGYGSTSQAWNGQKEAIGKTHTLVTWDMRGHGQTDYPDDPAAYNEPDTLADIEAILDAVGAKTAIIGGLSLGGYMSLAFYRAHPERVRALLILDTGPGFKNDEAREQWNTRARGTADDYDTRGLDVLKDLSPERRSATHRNAKGLAHAARGMLTQRDSNVISSLDQIKVPALIVVGENDTPFLNAADYMKVKIANSEKHVVPNAGHAVNIDQPEAFNKIVTDFLSRQPI
jgi:pimeloyl-ACP methyl ester carboxylesterase